MLDEIEAAHAVVGGARRARAFARQQINQAYVVVLASHFQKFCRDLHSNCADALIHAPALAPVQGVLRASLLPGRRLDSGNANPHNIAKDFGRFDVDLWAAIGTRDARSVARRQKLEAMNRWRNAIAHQDFRSPAFQSGESLRLSEVRSWRRACDCLSVDFDAELRIYLTGICGQAPW